MSKTLARKHKKLARSILDGALEAVEDALLADGEAMDMWTGDEEDWEGDHVGALCRYYAAEIRKAIEEMKP